MPWTSLERLLIVLAAALAAGWLLAGPAMALGPFSHLAAARKQWPEARRSLGASDDSLRPVFYAGALAVDAGYYPGAEPALGDAAHLLEPWEQCRALLAEARSPEERAFALGWLSHALLDVRGHGELVNPLVGGSFSHTKDAHHRLEWGLDCWLLAQPENLWLWEAPVDWRPGLPLWRRALARVFGRRVDEEVLARAMEAETAEVDRLPTVFWLSGRLYRPGRWAGNALGWILGNTARPAYVAWLEWRDQSPGARDVLNARRVTPEEAARLTEVLARAVAAFPGQAAGADWPDGSLDVDPACDGEVCPDARAARRWLADLPPTPGAAGRNGAKIEAGGIVGQP